MNMTQTISSLFGLLWLSGWISLQGIPGTGFIRSLFLFLGVLHFIWIFRVRTNTHRWPSLATEKMLLWGLTLWLVLQSMLFAVDPRHSLSELGEHYGKILLLVWLGFTLVAYQRTENDRWLGQAIFLGFFVHVISTLSFQFLRYVNTGQLAIGDSLLGNYGYVSPYVTGALAFLLADIASRLRGGRPLLPVHWGWIATATLLTLLAQGFLAAKGSLVMATALIVVAASTLRSHYRMRTILSAVAALLLITLITGTLPSNRWAGTINHLLYAVQHADITASFTGGDTGGDGSYYLRYTWAKAGIDGITAHPLGYGYGSEGFGKYILETQGISGAVSTHNGWLDFTLDNGIPGILLLLALSLTMVRRGWASFQSGNPWGLALSLFIINYIGRCAIDGHLVGSRLTGFAFATAILLALASRNQNANPPS